VKLYHTSKVVIQEPDIYYGRKNADFGQGFYLSPNIDFVRKWAESDFYLNEYQLDLEGLDVINLKRDKKWFDYIFQNRRLKDSLDADIIIGPIANDTIFDTFGIITSGFLTSEQALSLLMIGPEYRQVVIKSEKAKLNLKWLKASKFGDLSKDKESLRLEEEKYQEEFAKAMEKFQD